MTAPNNAGRYIGYWKFKNASGVLFGIGVTANRSFWVEINVPAPHQAVVLPMTLPRMPALQRGPVAQVDSPSLAPMAMQKVLR
jgi:hypothetical protein